MGGGGEGGGSDPTPTSSPAPSPLARSASKTPAPACKCTCGTLDCCTGVDQELVALCPDAVVVTKGGGNAVGIALGTVFAVAVVGAVATGFFLYRRKQRAEKKARAG